MPTIPQLKARAKQALSGKYFRIVLMFAFVVLFEEAFGLKLVAESFFTNVHKMSMPFTLYGYTYTYEYSYLSPYGFGIALTVIAVILSLMSLVCKVGEIRAAHALLHGDTPTLKTFFPFNLVFKVLAMTILRALLILGWAMIFLLPGILLASLTNSDILLLPLMFCSLVSLLIAYYRYSMAEHMLAEEPELSAFQALRESHRRMHGFKLRLLLLQISFIGWVLLLQLLISGLGSFFPASPLMFNTGVEILDVGVVPYLVELLRLPHFFTEVLVGVIAILLESCLTAYQETTTTAFYESIPEPGEAETPETGAETEEREKSAFGAENAAPEPEPDGDIERAHQLYLMYKCSARLMAKAGVTDEYRAAGATNFNEDLWRRDYSQQLMQRFDRDPDALGDLLALIDEYALDGLADRVIERIGRHVREESLDALDTLDMLGRALTVVTGAAFAENAGYVGRKKAQIASLCDALEPRLMRDAPEESWRDRLNAIRQLCR